MINNKISHKVFKHGHFLDLGMSVLLGIATYKSTALFHHDFSGFAVVTPYVSTGLLGLATLASSTLTLLGLASKGGFTGEIFASSSMEITNKEAQKIYKSLNSNEILSEEEVEEKSTFCNFVQRLSQAFTIDLKSEFKGEFLMDSGFYPNINKYPLIQKFYIENSLNKNTTVLSNLFLESLTFKYNHGRSYALDCFEALIDLHPELTEADQKALTFHFKKNSFDKKQEGIISFMSKKENFSLLNEENQKLFLQVFSVNNRNELIDLMKSENYLKNETSTKLAKIDDTKPLVIEDKPVVINHLSYENFNQFRINCENIYQQDKNLKVLLGKIEKVLLFKEKLLSFLDNNNSHDVATQLFLTQDVDKTINNFNREINILHKMKIMEHGDLDKNKDLVLSAMSSRIDIIIDKMNEHTQFIHQSLTDELNIQSEVNHKVLSAKM